MKIRAAVSDYLADLEIRQASRATIQKNQFHLEPLIAEFGDASLAEITPLDLSRWLQSLTKANGDPYAEASINGFVSALKGLFNYCVNNGHLAASPAERLRRKRYKAKSSRMATADHVAAVLDSLHAYAAAKNYENHALRDVVIISLSADSGGRLGELHNLTKTAVSRALASPIHTASGPLYRVESTGKTGEVTLRFGEETAYWLRLYLDSRPRSRSDYLFVSSTTHHQVHRSTISAAFMRLCEFAGVPTFRSHAVRHLNITSIMRSGGDPKVAANYANHTSEAITVEVYRHLIDGDVDEAAAGLINRRQDDDDIARFFGAH